MANVDIYEKWITVFSKHLREKIDSSENPSKAHMPDHSRRVWDKAKLICEKVGADPEVLVACAYLHDLARHEGLVIHGLRSAELAGSILEKEGFPHEKIDLVLSAISLHDHQTPKEKRESLESRVLYDTDKMDAFGAIGVKRHILYFWDQQKKAIPIDEIIKEYIIRKYDTLHFDESRLIAKKDYEYILDFFKRLKKDEE